MIKMEIIVLLALAMNIIANTSAENYDIVQCAEPCECFIYRGKFKADCSRRGLIELPSGLSTEMQILDLSYNQIEYFPSKINSYINLETIDLRNNFIKHFPSDGLSNLNSLEVLNLSNNSFVEWKSLNPNTFLTGIPIRELDLSYNMLDNFGNLAEEEILRSESLEVLILIQCNILSIHGSSPIAELTSLKTLILKHNPLRRIQKLSSTSLRHLDLSFCELNYIHHDELINMPALDTLIMPNNYRLLISTNIGSLSSESLKELDVSHCNLDQPGIKGFSDIETASLFGNMIRILREDEFVNNTKMFKLDLSSNSITQIHRNAFRGATSLRFLNLSLNMISTIADETFSRLSNLHTVILSRNYFTTFTKFKTSSLVKLDLSTCEIQNIDADAFSNKLSLEEINLSRNLISNIPDGISSKTLRSLDITYNRLSSINNNTFHLLPSLSILKLSGNRFSSIWKKEYFESNTRLEEITLYDNTWRCDCFEESMRDFFLYLTFEPAKVWNPTSLVCQTPSNVSGQSWYEACYTTWYGNTTAQTDDQVLTFLMVMFVSFVICFFIIAIVRKGMKRRMEALREERERQVGETRERLSLIRLQHDQQAQCNAPDPRDLVSPPSYNEALLLPRLDGSFHSLADHTEETEKNKRKRRKGRRRTKSSNDLLENNTINGTAEVDSVENLDNVITRLERSPRSRRRRISMDSAMPITETVQIEVNIEEGYPQHRISLTHTNSLRESDL